MIEFYKRLFTVSQAHHTMFEAFSTVKYLKMARKKNLISHQFSERIMLAVTEVNGCEICNYYHTEEALKSGLTDKEIQKIVSGDSNDIPIEETKAIMFAQHYADTLGVVNNEAKKAFVDYYGNEKSLAIVAAIRMIMMGNAYGIPLSAFKRRLKNKPVKKSSLGYELAILLSFLPSIIIAFIKVLFGVKDSLKNELLS